MSEDEDSSVTAPPGAAEAAGSVALDPSVGSLPSAGSVEGGAGEQEQSSFLAVDYAYARNAGFTSDWLYPTDHSVVRRDSAPLPSVPAAAP